MPSWCSGSHSVLALQDTFSKICLGAQQLCSQASGQARAWSSTGSSLRRPLLLQKVCRGRVRASAPNLGGAGSCGHARRPLASARTACGRKLQVGTERSAVTSAFTFYDSGLRSRVCVVAQHGGTDIHRGYQHQRTAAASSEPEWPLRPRPPRLAWASDRTSCRPAPQGVPKPSRPATLDLVAPGPLDAHVIQSMAKATRRRSARCGSLHPTLRNLGEPTRVTTLPLEARYSDTPSLRDAMRRTTPGADQGIPAPRRERSSARQRRQGARE